MRSTLSVQQNRKRQRERGSILVICMVLAALGTIGVAAWIALLDARGNQVEANVTALQHRAVTRNSKALAYRALYANHLHTISALGSDVTYQLPDSLGQCTISSYSGNPLQNADAMRISRNGGTPVRSFTTDVNVSLPHATGTENWQYQMRSYNPILGGDLLSIHPPLAFDDTAPLVDGKLIVEGRAFFWDVVQTDFSGDFQADEILLPNEILGTTQFQNAAGTGTLPLNYPIPKQTTGLAGAATPYEGKMDLFYAAGNNGHNSYETRITAAGNYTELNGQTAVAFGSGPATRPPTSDDTEAETLIATRTPEDLVVELVKFYPLSSPVLQKVFEKSDNPFNDDQLYQVLSGQGTLANDSLTELVSNHESRLKVDDLRALHQASGTVYSSSGSGKMRVFFNRTNLTNLIFKQVNDLEIHGQATDALDSQAEGYAPQVLLVLNDASTTLASVNFYEKNARRFVLAISSDAAAPATTQFNFTGATSFPNWHGVLELQNTTAEIDTSAVSEAVIVGGIRTNQPINVLSGNLRIKQQFDPKGLEAILSRNAWIEAYQL